MKIWCLWSSSARWRGRDLIRFGDVGEVVANGGVAEDIDEDGRQDWELDVDSISICDWIWDDEVSDGSAEVGELCRGDRVTMTSSRGWREERKAASWVQARERGDGASWVVNEFNMKKKREEKVGVMVVARHRRKGRWGRHESRRWTQRHLSFALCAHSHSLTQITYCLVLRYSLDKVNFSKSTVLDPSLVQMTHHMACNT